MLLTSILQKHWGFSSFRPMQEEIILSVMDGRDTLALLPTGGGKSICFQVPGLAREGLCLVISPLIALMKDQVQNLRKRDIPAHALYSGMHRREIELVYNQCHHQKVKFLYLSPERLESAEILEKLGEWKISLLAVDEAHCISQWGYDFRPPYLRIASIRTILPGVPVLALTATATPLVVKDIQEKLEFRQPRVFQKSFHRSNLAYFAFEEEDKRGRLLRIIQKTGGSGIVYVRNRRKTQEIAQWLTRNQISSTFYHAGLEADLRSKRQDDWISGKVRVMVATNAFGMGIDKPDVRFVVHIDLPESLEAYFQEAGRAGRDEKSSYSVALFDQADIAQLRTSLSVSYPEPETIRKIYAALGNYAHLPVGMGKDVAIDFGISSFCQTYKFNPLTVHKVLSFLEKEGYLVLSDDLEESSRVNLRVDRRELYDFQVRHPVYDEFLKLMLRSYGGLFTDFVPVKEAELAARSGTGAEIICQHLIQLQQMGVLTYLPQKTTPQIIFCRERVDERYLVIDKQNYLLQKERAVSRMEAVIAYASSGQPCRSQQLLAYFGELRSQPCGSCDVCLAEIRKRAGDAYYQSLKGRIRKILLEKPAGWEELRMRMTGAAENDWITVVNSLLDSGIIKMNRDELLTWNED